MCLALFRNNRVRPSVYLSETSWIFTKLLHTSSENSEIHKTPLYKNEKAKKINQFLFTRYFDYVKQYDKVVEKRFPTAVKAYRFFMLGVKDFYSDMKEYLRIVMKITGTGKTLSDLSLKELEIYYFMPREMWKAAPVLLLSALPFALYIVLPVAYYFPGYLLTHHFWTREQKHKFCCEQLKKRLRHNRPVFRALQADLYKVHASNTYNEWKEVLGMLGSGIHPSPKDILVCRDIFTSGPYNINKINVNHVRHLLDNHAVKALFFRRSRLVDHAWMLILMDRAIIREGGLNTLTEDELRMCCHVRGLEASELSRQAMLEWLRQWLIVSSHLESKACASVILHTPILLGYNHPSNWSALHEK